MTLPSELLVGRYRLLAIIGQGGMATVYRAHDEMLDREVAVKLLRPGFGADPSFVERFRGEARHAASLQHQHIVTIHDTGVDPEAGDFIVMNLVDGPDLQWLLERDGALPIGFAVRIGIETARALQAAHDHGIIHRDVKPANILIDRDGEARVADFGIARAVTDIGKTTAGSILGSAQYTSPEQVAGDPVSPRSDIYSLGIVLYEALTGIRPFDGPTPAAAALQRLQVEPRPAREHRAEIPVGLEAIVMRALQRDPERRYPSAMDMASDLERFRINELGGVRRRGVGPRAQRRGVPGLVAAGSGSAGGGTAVALASALDDERADGPWSFHETVIERGSRDPDPERRRRRVPLLAIVGAVGLATLSLIVLVGTASLLGMGVDDGVLGQTGVPEGSAAAVALATASPAPTSSPLASPSPSPMPTPSATASPTPAPTPTAEPTPPPTPKPTPEPTPRPTAPPVAPAGPARDPAETVRRFYDLVEQHEFDAAARLWSPRMREEYPPDAYIDGRFAPTTRIDIDRLSIRSMDLGEGTAVVDVAITEYRDNGDVRRFVGRWDLVLRDGTWLMDEPHF